MVFKKIIECVTVFVVFAFKAQSKDLGNGSDSGSVVFDLAWIPHTHTSKQSQQLNGKTKDPCTKLQ